MLHIPGTPQAWKTLAHVVQGTRPLSFGFLGRQCTTWSCNPLLGSWYINLHMSTEPCSNQVFISPNLDSKHFAEFIFNLESCFINRNDSWQKLTTENTAKHHRMPDSWLLDKISFENRNSFSIGDYKNNERQHLHNPVLECRADRGCYICLQWPGDTVQWCDQCQQTLHGHSLYHEWSGCWVVLSSACHRQTLNTPHWTSWTWSQSYKTGKREEKIK